MRQADWVETTSTVPRYPGPVDLALQIIANEDKPSFPWRSWKFLIPDMCRCGLLTSDGEDGWVLTAWGKAELRARGWQAPWWTWTGLKKRGRGWLDRRRIGR